jgi:N-acetylglucosaminyl-diphospho-decaprenol L-rhamnosyltransferase
VPDLSVVVVTHNGREAALETLAAAKARTGAVDVEWFVVDNASTDGTPEAVESAHPDVRVLRRPNLGFAAGNNAALELARGRHLLLLNPDVVIRAGTLADLVSALDARPEVGAAGVIQLDAEERIYPSTWRFPGVRRQLGEALFARRWPVFRHLQEAEVDAGAEERSVDWVTGSFLAVRREAAADAGPLDERFFLYAEETDWCYRIRGAGWDIRQLTDLTVVHHHASGAARDDLMAHMAHSKRLFATKHLGPARRRGFVAALALRHAIRSAIFGAMTLADGSYRARAAAERRALTVALRLSEPRGPTP